MMKKAKIDREDGGLVYEAEFLHNGIEQRHLNINVEEAGLTPCLFYVCVQ